MPLTSSTFVHLPGQSPSGSSQPLASGSSGTKVQPECGHAEPTQGRGITPMQQSPMLETLSVEQSVELPNMCGQLPVKATPICPPGILSQRSPGSGSLDPSHETSSCSESGVSSPPAIAHAPSIPPVEENAQQEPQWP